MPVLCLAQNDPETAAAKSKTLLNATGNYNLAAIAGHAESLAVHPHATASVVHLKKAVAQCAKGFRNGARNGYIFAGKVTGVANDVGNFCVCRTSRQQCRGNQCSCQ